MVDSSKTRFHFSNCASGFAQHNLRRLGVFAGAALIATSAGVLWGASACVDPNAAFDDFEERVVDAGDTVVVGSCNGGEIPDVNGEFYFALEPSIAQSTNLLFRVEVTLTGAPSTIATTFQPLCNTEQCEAGEAVGDAITVAAVEVSDSCTFTVPLVEALIPGAANPISGSDIIGNIDLLGSLRSTELFCGVVEGTARVGGNDVDVTGSTFGAVRITGSDLPEAVDVCPPLEEMPDAGVPAPDAMP